MLILRQGWDKAVRSSKFGKYEYDKILKNCPLLQKENVVYDRF